MNATDTPRDIHALGEREALDLLGTDPVNGLMPREAEERLDRYGPNEIIARAPVGPWGRMLAQFLQPLVYVLLIAAGVVLALGEWVDASVILGVVIVNALVGFFQEGKAEKAILALAGLVVTEATVRRGGRVIRISSRELVPGDVLMLQSGDRVPADIRLLKVRNLRVDESMLSGESVPVEKQVGRLALGTVLADRRNVAFTGTLVTYGQAEGVVWATGARTETGRIAGLISVAEQLETPLTRKIAVFSRLLMFLILGLAAVTFMIGLTRGEPPVDMFMAAVALAVGAIPEGLPAAVTITLAVGVSRLARRRAVVRRLPAVETLGSTTVICSDKTGTLTENQMTVREIHAGGRTYQVTGAGYDPAGSILLQGEPAGLPLDHSLAECLRAGLLCNDSAVVVKDGLRTVRGDPTEAALIVAAEKAGLSAGDLAGEMPRVDTLAFESEHQYMATLHHRDGEDTRVIYKKGAVERLLGKCHDALDPSGRLVDLDRAKVQEIADSMASEGLRVLGFARRIVPLDQQRVDHHHVAGALTFLGLQGMIDPPREEAIRAVARCRRAGISVKMITGDHLLTALAIARRLGLDGDGCGALSGRALDEVPDEELPEVAEATAVFARVAPEQKVRLVRALQAKGHIVAMTGDGVNDAPALKQADIGIAMGIGGTDVAKGAADIILTDDNFASIENAVEEGRGVFDNLIKCIVWEIPCNFGEGLTLLAAIGLGTALPALPVQLLWVNMMTAVILGFALVFEPRENDLMTRPPRDPKQPILDFPLFMRTGLLSLIILAGCFGLFVWEQEARGRTVAEARTIVVNVIVMVEIFYLLNCRSLIRSVWAIGFFSNPWVVPCIAAMIAAQMVFTYAPVMNRLFHSAPLDGPAWLHITGVGLVAYLAVELEKWLRRRARRTGVMDLGARPAPGWPMTEKP